MRCTEYGHQKLSACGLKPRYGSRYCRRRTLCSSFHLALYSRSLLVEKRACFSICIILATSEVETPNPGQQVGSFPQNFQTGLSAYVGSPWNSGLFDCYLDQTNAVMTTIFPCVTFGQIAEVLDATDTSRGSLLSCPFGSLFYLLSMTVCAHCFIGCTYRKRLRNRYGLVEAPYEDVISHIFCPCCSLCQEFRELKERGLDPALGWNGILARQQSMQQANEQLNTPPQAQAMSK